MKVLKVNFFKYIFIIIVIVLIGFGVYTIYNQNKEKEIGYNQVQEVEQQQMITNLRLGIHQYDTINPILSQNKNIQFIDKLVFEPLMNINSDYSLTNCLAKECSKTGDTSYVIKLKDDVVWQDGSPLIAQDVKFTIDKLKEEGIESIYKDNVANISGLEVIDDKTIKINLFSVQPFFEYNLIFHILSKNYENEDFLNSSKIPTGTGMYKIDKLEGSFISLIKNEQWWDKTKNSKIDTITVNIYTSMGEVYNAFKIGNIDLIPTSNVNFKEYIGTIGFNVQEYKAREYDFIAINTQDDVLSKKEVRKAITCGIDKSNIVSTVFDNNYYTCEYPLDYGNYLYNNDVSYNTYNPEYSQQVLEENGWTFRSKQWQKVENYKTLRTTFDLVVNSSNVRRVAVAETIKNQLANIGIIINVRKVSDSQYRYYLENKNYDMIIAGVDISAAPNLTRYFGENNLANYHNDRAVELLNDTYTAKDEKTLREKYTELQQIYMEDVPFVSLYRNREYVVYNTNLLGDQKPNWFNVFYNIENWYRQN